MMRTQPPDTVPDPGETLGHMFPNASSEGDELRLPLVPKVSLLSSIVDVVEAFGEAHAIPPQQIFLVNLEIDELITNYVRYSVCKVARPRMQLTLRVTGDKLVLVIFDTGPPFNPLTDAPEPDLSGDIDRRSMGGVGLHLVRSYCDRMEHELVGGCNRLTLEHRLQPPATGEPADARSEDPR